MSTSSSLDIVKGKLRDVLDLWPIFGGMVAIAFAAYKFAIYLFVYVYLKTIGALWLIPLTEISDFYSGSFLFVAAIVISATITISMLPVESSDEPKFRKYIFVKMGLTQGCVFIGFLALIISGIFYPEYFVKILTATNFIIWIGSAIILTIGLLDFPFYSIKYGISLRWSRIKGLAVITFFLPSLVIGASAWFKAKNDRTVDTTSLPILELKHSSPNIPYGALLIKEERAYVITLDSIRVKKLEWNDFKKMKPDPVKRVRIMGIDSIFSVRYN